MPPRRLRLPSFTKVSWPYAGRQLVLGRQPLWPFEQGDHDALRSGQGVRFPGFVLSSISLQCCQQRRESERRAKGKSMHLSDQGLLVILVVGVIAGWLAGKVLRGNGFGLVGDAAIGIVGALIGDWLLHRLGSISAPASLAS